MHSVSVTDWTSPAPETLLPAEIHIWRFPLQAALDGDTILTGPEQQQLQQISNPHRKQTWLNSRIVLRRLLGRYLACQPQELRFEVSPRGKPYLRDNPLYFNLSHSGQWGLLAIASGFPLGVDLEQFRRVRDPIRIARRMFPPEAQAMLTDCPVEEQEPRFFELWTLMEAQQKLTGEGIFGNITSPRACHTLSFIPDPGYAAALAWPRGISRSTSPGYFQFAPDKR